MWHIFNLTGTFSHKSTVIIHFQVFLGLTFNGFWSFCSTFLFQLQLKFKSKMISINLTFNGLCITTFKIIIDFSNGTSIAPRPGNLIDFKIIRILIQLFGIYYKLIKFKLPCQMMCKKCIGTFLSLLLKKKLTKHLITVIPG